MKFNRLIKPLALGLLMTVLIGEIAVRIVGLVDFPTYAVVDDQIGYIPRPTQKGCFLIDHCWAFNDLSMDTAVAWNPERHPNVLLIGNSVVMGGNPYDQRDKLPALLQQKLGTDYSLWPIAVGGWTNVNELVYLQRHTEVLAHAKFFVWEFMSGGLSQASPWLGEYVFPTTRPICALCYVIRRYLLPRFVTLNMDSLPPQGTINPASLAKFEETLAEISRIEGRKQPGILFLYPNNAELQTARHGREWLTERAELERLSRQYDLKLLDLSTYPEWTPLQYRDGTHPTVQGNMVLAAILSAAIRDSVNQEPLH
jgi:hypothetical protein